MRALILLLLLSSTAQANYNGEKWNFLSGFTWFLGEGCPAYVEQVAIDIFKTMPVANTYGGSLGQPAVINRDNVNVLYCSEQEPAQNLELPEPGISSDEQSIVAGKTRWWFETTGAKWIREFDIWLRISTLSPLTVHRVVWHEAFHAMGLQHDQSEDALMYWATTVNEPDILDLKEISKLYNQCRVVADSNADLFIPGVDMTRWIKSQPQIVQDQFAAYIDKRVSFIQSYATTYPDQISNVEISNCP